MVYQTNNPAAQVAERKFARLSTTEQNKIFSSATKFNRFIDDVFEELAKRYGKNAAVGMITDLLDVPEEVVESFEVAEGFSEGLELGVKLADGIDYSDVIETLGSIFGG